MKYLIIDSRPRAGSHLLQRALNTVDGVLVDEEVFAWDYYGEPMIWDWKVSPAGWIKRQAPEDAAVGGTIIQDYQYRAIPILSSSIRRLHPCVVILHRRDLLAQFASLTIANIVHNYESNLPREVHDITLRPSPSELHLYGERIVAGMRASLQRWKSSNYILLSYESLVSVWGRVLADVSNLVDFDVTSAQIKTYRLEQRDMHDVIENYHEASSILNGYVIQVDQMLAGLNWKPVS